MMLLVTLLLLILQFITSSANYRTEDLFFPNDCESLANIDDHVLVEYEVYFSNGTLATSLKKPSQLIHVHLTMQVQYSFKFFFFKFLTEKNPPFLLG
jgi:hypothetical protein